MTGGRAVILGPTGRNFAAGMSGGVAYIWDPDNAFSARCNHGMVELEALSDDTEIRELQNLIRMHFEATGSGVAERMLARWPDVLGEFVKVMPTDFKRVLRERQAREEDKEAQAHA